MSNDEIRAAAIAVVEAWQRREISGLAARQLVGARSYGDLYRLLMVNNLPVAFRPRDVATSVKAGEMSAFDGMELLGIEHLDELEAFLAAWTAGEN